MQLPLLECSVENLLHAIFHSESSDQRGLAAEKVLDLYEAGMNLSLEDLAYVVDNADEPHASRANKIIRDNI